MKSSLVALESRVSLRLGISSIPNSTIPIWPFTDLTESTLSILTHLPLLLITQSPGSKSYPNWEPLLIAI